MISGLLRSPHVVDLALAVLVLEPLAIAFRRRRRGLPPRLADPIIALLPGIFLLLALRAALAGDSGSMVAVWLTAALPAHLADLWRRPP